MKGAFKAADRSGAAVTVVIGENELETGTAVVKTMSTGEQEPVPLEAILGHVTRAVGR